MNKTIINTPKAPAPIGPYSQAVKVGGFLFLSGQIALVPETSELKIDNIAEETKQVMENLKAVLEEAGFNFGNVLKTSIFLKEMSSFATVNEEYGKYFEKDLGRLVVSKFPIYCIHLLMTCIRIKSIRTYYLFCPVIIVVKRLVSIRYLHSIKVFKVNILFY